MCKNLKVYLWVLIAGTWGLSLSVIIGQKLTNSDSTADTATTILVFSGIAMSVAGTWLEYMPQGPDQST